MVTRKISGNTSMKIVIVQNTSYHFETVISLYQTCRELNFTVAVYICDYVKNKNVFKQLEFLQQHGADIITLDQIKKDDICFVVSAHPNKQQLLPNKDDPVFKQGFHCLFISHRFDAAAKYAGPIVTKRNSFCLSPLAEQQELKHIWLTDAIFPPVYTPITEQINISVQGHFRFGHRRLEQLRAGLKSKKEYAVNLLGTESRKKRTLVFENDPRVRAYAWIPEDVFYDLANNKTHFFLPLVDDSICKNKYLTDVYSSTFNIAAICEKPIFAHEVFQDIYKLPGIYYTTETFDARLNELLRISEADYRALVDQYAPVKQDMLQHNKAVVFPRVQAFYNLKRDTWYG